MFLFIHLIFIFYFLFFIFYFLFFVFFTVFRVFFFILITKEELVISPNATFLKVNDYNGSILLENFEFEPLYPDVARTASVLQIDNTDTQQASIFIKNCSFTNFMAIDDTSSVIKTSNVMALTLINNMFDTNSIQSSSISIQNTNVIVQQTSFINNQAYCMCTTLFSRV